MKKLIPFLFASFVLFISCKKDKEPLSPDDSIPKSELSDNGYIQNLEIGGAKKITFDAEHNAYLVTLPAEYQNDIIRLKFKFYAGTTFSPGNQPEVPEQLDLTFRGSDPPQFTLVDKAGVGKLYSVYVKHEGSFEISTYQADKIPYDSDGSLGIQLNMTGIGTVPEVPGGTQTIKAILKNEKTGTIVEGKVFREQAIFNSVLTLAGGSDISINLIYNGQTFVVAQKKKLIKGITRVFYIGHTAFFSPTLKNEPFTISGEGFGSNARYSIRLENDYITQPIIAPAERKGQGLDVKLPTGIPNGTYKVSILENDAIVGSQVSTFTEKNTDLAIGQIWTKQSDHPTAVFPFFAANKIMVERGKSIFLVTLPGMVRIDLSTAAPSTFPNLLLTKAQKQNEFPGILRTDRSFGDGAFHLYYGEFQIPPNIEPGLYEARLVYSNRAESMPFWSKIEIK